MQPSERINYIKKWILDYCKSMSKEPQTLVVGISGGIDSSVTSAICALTGKKTIVLSMPINQIKEQQELSLKHQNLLLYCLCQQQCRYLKLPPDKVLPFLI